MEQGEAELEICMNALLFLLFLPWVALSVLSHLPRPAAPNLLAWQRQALKRFLVSVFASSLESLTVSFMTAL